MITIREKKNKWEDIIFLHYELFPDDEMMDFRKTRIWGAYDDGKLIGFASYKDMGNGYCYFTRAGVLRSHRGQGIHGRLIKRRINAARKEGFAFATTYTILDNQKSYDNLQDMGFRMYEPKEGDHYAGKYDVVYWRKKLC